MAAFATRPARHFRGLFTMIGPWQNATYVAKSAWSGEVLVVQAENERTEFNECGSPTMTSKPLVDAMNRELAAASPDLVGNDDVLRAVLAGCGDCIKVLDLDGRLQFMSDGGKRVMEVDDFSVLKGCPWPDFWSGDGNRDALAAVEAAKAGKTARFRGAANTAKGNPRYWDVQVSPIFGAAGKSSQLLSISRDITEEWEAAAA